MPDTSRPAISKKPEALHKATAYVRPLGHGATAERPSEKRIALAPDRRRTQRVMLRVRANVHVAEQGKETTLEATTISVSDRGALLILKKGLAPDCRLVLEHAQSKQRVAARVTRTPQETPEGFHVSVEFDSAAPNFWGIAFPPSDWRPVD